MKKIFTLCIAITGFYPIAQSQECCFNIGNNSYVRYYSPTYGCWMQDPLETDGAGKVFAMPSYNNLNILYEYASMADFINNNISQSYTLPYGYEGTGHVIYGGYLYYCRYNSNTMVKWDISAQTTAGTAVLPNAGFHNTYHYGWGGFSDIDFAVDENGLWVLYSTASNNGKLVVSKLDTSNLSVIQTWNTNSETKKTMGNAFIICGVVYCIDSYSTINQTINYKYNTWTSSGTNVSIPWTNANSYNSMTDYNPNTGLLYSWNNANCYTYPVNFIGPTTTSSSVDVLCYGNSTGTATVHASGGQTPYSYQWDANTGNQTDSTATGLAAGTYVVTVTDNNNCYSIDSVVVSEPPLLVLTTASTDVLCHGDSLGNASVTPSGGVTPYTYQWDANTGNQTDSTATGLAAGTYVVTVTDNNGCTDMDTVSLSEPPALTIAVSSTDDVEQSCVGSATALPGGGAPPYSYQWDANTGNQTLQTATALCEGTYFVSITDDNGCLISDSAVIGNVSGIDNSNIDTRLTIYPNPANGVVFIQVSSIEEQSFELSLQNALGEHIRSSRMHFPAGSSTQTMDLSDLARGIYTLRLTSSGSYLLRRIAIR